MQAFKTKIIDGSAAGKLLQMRCLKNILEDCISVEN
jgi:hypothetical protein